MTILVRDLVHELRFPLYAVHPRHWRGAAFVGDTERREGRLTSVAFVYEEPGRGFEVDNVEAGSTDIDDDFVRFVSRFDARFVTKRVKRRKRGFPEGAFTSSTIQTTVRGTPATIKVLEHRELPLVIAPLRLEERSGATDVWVCGWRMDVRDLVPLVVPLDPEMVAAFDFPGEPYPPPGWDLSERDA